MAIAFAASARGVFSSVAKTLAFALPASLARGDVMMALVAHNAADARGTTPAGWAFVVSLGSGADTLDVYTRMVDSKEPSSVVFALATVANEWQGELVVLRGTSPGIVVEASASIPFTGSAIPTVGVTSQQAISLIVSVCTCAGFPSLTVPTGFTFIDGFNTAVVSGRTMLLGYKIAGATGALSFPNIGSEIIVTGGSFSLVLRNQIPVQPAPLVDLVPGNLGLLGKDTRPAR
jgi:hypothetical protein